MHYYNKLKTKKSICTGNKQKIYIHQASQQNRIKKEMKEVDCHEKINQKNLSEVSHASLCRHMPSVGCL